MKKPDTDKMSLRMEHIWLEAENRIIEDIVRRIKKAGKITSTADYQINRLVEMGKSTEEVERILKEALNATYPEMFKLYDDIAEWQYARDKSIYEQVNQKFIPAEENEQLKQISAAVSKQTQDALKNLAQSYGYSVLMGNKRVFTPFSEYYQKYVDGRAAVAGANIAINALNAARRSLDEHSPSRKMRKVGRYFSEGFALGIEDEEKMAKKASENLSKIALNSMDMPEITARMHEVMAMNTNRVTRQITSQNIHVQHMISDERDRLSDKEVQAIGKAVAEVMNDRMEEFKFVINSREFGRAVREVKK